MALVQYPKMIESPHINQIFPKDVVQRAQNSVNEIMSVGKEGKFPTKFLIGAYSHSQGVPFVRKNVADFIAKRDGHPSDPGIFSFIIH